MLTITNDDNYLLQVVQLRSGFKHPNADRLQIWKVNGYEVITDMSRNIGDICVLFPLECQVSYTLLSKLNLYSDKTMNEDQTVAGYVHSTGRIRATKLRGVVSEGMLIDLESVLMVCNVRSDWRNHFLVGQKFDTINGELVSEKYVPVLQKSSTPGTPGAQKNKLKNILVEPFPFHYSTSKLQDNAWRFRLEDNIVLTDKWHGTSAVFSNLRTRRKLSIWEKIKSFFGYAVQKTEYAKTWASRTVLKGVKNKHVSSNGYYTEDIWKTVFDEIEHTLFPTYTIYGEIVGYLPNGKMIQKDYDYGCKPGKHAFLVYRITNTNDTIVEYSWEEVKDFCLEHGLQTVKEMWSGTVETFTTDFGQEDETFLDSLKRIYLEKNCDYCVNKVPAEGICIRHESEYPYMAYKLKSKAFLLKETAALDTNEEVVE